MGDMADDITNAGFDAMFDDMFDDQIFHKPRHRGGPKDYQRRTKPDEWRDGNGAVHVIKHMTTTHIMACLAICERYGHHKARAFEQELKKRVEEAQRYVQINPAFPPEFYQT